MKYHGLKMEEVNDTMKYLWNKTYQGTGALLGPYMFIPWLWPEGLQILMESRFVQTLREGLQRGPTTIV